MNSILLGGLRQRHLLADRLKRGLPPSLASGSFVFSCRIVTFIMRSISKNGRNFRDQFFALGSIRYGCPDGQFCHSVILNRDNPPPRHIRRTSAKARQRCHGPAIAQMPQNSRRQNVCLAARGQGHANEMPLLTIGSTATCVPAFAMALARAGTEGGVPGSPTPLGGAADGTICVSIAPISPIRSGS